MTRNGKIARLPRSIRNELNRRLQDGETGTRLIDWLNDLPEVNEVLERDFGGRPINGQNLTEWKQGGYEDWVRHQETVAMARQLAEDAAELKEQLGTGSSIADLLSPSIAIALAACAREVAGKSKDDPQSRRQLLAVAQELAKVRRGDHEQERVRIEREQWEAKRAEAETKKKSRDALAPFWDLLLTRQFAGLFEDDMRKNGGEIPPDLQAFLARIGSDAQSPIHRFPVIQWPQMAKQSQTESK